MRGEYAAATELADIFKELPPRARRIHSDPYTQRHHIGTTSACAENTLILLFTLLILWNYLRVRGEYIAAASGTPAL